MISYTVKNILTYPNKTLRTPCTPFAGNFDSSIKKTSQKLLRLMRKNDGIGLSANQVGINICLSAIDLSLAQPANQQKKLAPRILINPEIIFHSRKTITMEEGCLSLPNLYGQVERPEKIRLQYQNESGKKIKLAASGLLARVIQHEVDHLNGILFIDKVIPGTLKEITPEDVCRDLKIVFIGTSDFGQPTLIELVKHKMIPKLIISEPDKPAGRGHELTSSPIKEYAQKFRLPLIQPPKITTAYAKIKAINPDLIITTAYGQIIPKKIISLPRLGSINLHPSLLPKYRGASPIASAILESAEETGVSIILMDEKIDHGPIIIQKKIKIDKDDTTPSLSVKLADLAARLTLQTVDSFARGKIKLVKQHHRQATYVHRFAKEDGRINWQDKPEKIEAQIRALQSWPGTFTEINGKRLIIKSAHLDADKLIIDEVQPEGKRIMNFADFLRGAPPAVDFFKKIGYNVK